MELGLDKEPQIDPEVTAHVFSLVSALGGSSAGDDGRYVLGDDALAVLKDIKRWLRLYDDKQDVLDVARSLADANLVKGDLLEILVQWREDAPEGSFMSKIALLCVDLLTQLTWPIDMAEDRATMNRYLHIPTLQKAQASYKQAVLHHDSAQIMRTVVRVGLPAVAVPSKERSPTEDNIVKIVLYFFRNIAMITLPDDITVDEADSDISRSTTIDAFHRQDIFSLILTVCSNMTDNFSTHDVEVLDLMYQLVRGVNVENLFMKKDEVISSNTKDLQALISKEKGMMASYARHAPSRHNRFGTMLWVKRDGGEYTTVFGQSAIANEQMTMSAMDNSKKWKRPTRPAKKDKDEPASEFDTSVRLTAAGRRHLRRFIEQFLDSSFNPLFAAVRRAIEREADRVLDSHKRMYLYLISWFLRAEAVRRKKQTLDKWQCSSSAPSEFEDYALIASVLNQETFVLLNRLMQSAQDGKRWVDLSAGMKCFTQILLTVQDMSESPLDVDQEIAENILSRIFYEQSTHDRITGLLRSYNDQGFGYLDTCTELSHVFLRLLERYSKQNLDLQVRSKRKARQEKKKQNIGVDRAPADNDDRETEANDVADAQRTVSERKFDFTRFATKFVNQASVDTFVAFLKYYKDLTEEQLKRAHRFFYRVAFKMDLTVYLFRLDIIALLNKLVKGPEGLALDNSTFKEWEELSQQVFRRLVKKMEERPALAVEVLFSKINSTMFYLEHGYEREISKKAPRAVAELEVRPGMEMEQQLGVAVSALINQSKSDALAWIKGVLHAAATERKAWDDQAAAQRSNDGGEESTIGTAEAARPAVMHSIEVSPGESLQPEQPKMPSILVRADNPERKLALRKDKHLRLLLSLLGFLRLVEDEIDTTWTIPSSIPAEELSHDVELINKFEYDPPIYEDGKSAEAFIRNKNTARKRGMFSEDEDNDDEGVTDAEGLFPAGGPTVRRSSNSPAPKKTIRRRNRYGKDELLDDEGLEERNEAKRKMELEKGRKIKSELYVRDSDDESDEERDRAFFAMEEQRRKNTLAGLSVAASKVKASPKAAKQKRKSARSKEKRPVTSESEAGSEDDADTPPAKRHRSTGLQALLDLSDHDSDNTGSEDDETHVKATDKPQGFMSATMNSDDEDEQSRDRNTEADTDQGTPPSSVHRSSRRLDGPYDKTGSDGQAAVDLDDRGGEESDKENADTIVTKVVPSRSRRMRAGFVLDSDSE